MFSEYYNLPSVKELEVGEEEENQIYYKGWYSYNAILWPTEQCLEFIAMLLQP